ncbi:MAG: hypothetical protein AB7H77_04690, partial [Bdellovibrionales bacterium]
QLEVVSQLTPQDNINMFNFTFQNSGKVHFKVNTLDNKAEVRVQLLDTSGTRILADSEGKTKALKDAYATLISREGLDLKNGKYVIKVTYGAGTNKNQNQNYAIQVGSGTTFKSDYRTLASATTIKNTLMAGGSLGYNSLSSTAALLASQSAGQEINIFGVLTLFNTKLY